MRSLRLRHGLHAAICLLLVAVAPAACGDPPAPPPVLACDGSGPEQTIPSEGWTHLPEGTPIQYKANPPASGTHYPAWARHRAYDWAFAPGYWLHNIEHGAVVLLYRPDASPAAIAALEEAYAAAPIDARCGHRRALLLPYPPLAPAVAVVSAYHVLAGDQLTAAQVRSMIERCRGHAPEDACADGIDPPPLL